VLPRIETKKYQELKQVGTVETKCGAWKGSENTATELRCDGLMQAIQNEFEQKALCWIVPLKVFVVTAKAADQAENTVIALQTRMHTTIIYVRGKRCGR
jgi:hypothetical protein